jgi:hypothetical protein
MLPPVANFINKQLCNILHRYQHIYLSFYLVYAARRKKYAQKSLMELAMLSENGSWAIKIV